MKSRCIIPAWERCNAYTTTTRPWYDGARVTKEGVMRSKGGVSSQTATVYFAPTAGRRFITLRGAAEAEARARIYRMFPSIPHEDDTGYGYDIRWDEPEKYARHLKRLTTAALRQFRKQH